MNLLRSKCELYDDDYDLRSRIIMKRGFHLIEILGCHSNWESPRTEFGERNLVISQHRSTTGAIPLESISCHVRIPEEPPLINQQAMQRPLCTVHHRRMQSGRNPSRSTSCDNKNQNNA
ncbi:hypothetical protein CDAR_62521 [Caerostris darwini]|uniref:Uncharacterized protein n=1 Tax=Caerostris darwini TaxID=1538125 RepID=A0AAV4UFE2_9ARAC|nr:hypothetical protein CDAR_62521 [Caerostris darwini]